MRPQVAAPKRSLSLQKLSDAGDRFAEGRPGVARVSPATGTGMPTIHGNQSHGFHPTPSLWATPGRPSEDTEQAKSGAGRPRPDPSSRRYWKTRSIRLKLGTLSDPGPGASRPDQRRDLRVGDRLIPGETRSLRQSGVADTKKGEPELGDLRSPLQRDPSVCKSSPMRETVLRRGDLGSPRCHRQPVRECPPIHSHQSHGFHPTPSLWATPGRLSEDTEQAKSGAGRPHPDPSSRRYWKTGSIRRRFATDRNLGAAVSRSRCGQALWAGGKRIQRIPGQSSELGSARVESSSPRQCS